MQSESKTCSNFKRGSIIIYLTFLFSEPNNDSPMNPHAAVLWADKVEMRQRVLLEHKKSESQ